MHSCLMHYQEFRILLENAVWNPLQFLCHLKKKKYDYDNKYFNYLIYSTNLLTNVDKFFNTVRLA